MELQEAEQEPLKTLFQLVGEDFIRVADPDRKAGGCLSRKTKPGWARALVNLNNSYEERDGTNISNLVGDYLTNTVI